MNKVTEQPSVDALIARITARMEELEAINDALIAENDCLHALNDALLAENADLYSDAAELHDALENESSRGVA